MLAEVDGVARVALDLSDGSVAADPFVTTNDLVKLLRVHAAAKSPRRSRSTFARRHGVAHA